MTTDNEPSKRSKRDALRSGLRRVLSYMYQVRGLYAVSFLALVGASGVTAAKAWIVQPVGDSLFQSGFDRSDLLTLCGIVAGIFLLQAIFNLIHTVVAKTAGARITRSIRHDLFERLLTQDRAYFITRASGDLVSRVVNDVIRLESAGAGSLQNVVRDLLTLALLFGVMLLHSWKLSMFTVGVASVIGWFLWLMNRHIRVMSRRAQETIAAIVRALSEVIGGMEVVITHRAGARWHERFNRVNGDYYRNVVRLEKTNAVVMAAIQIVMGLGIATVLLLTGRALLDGEMTEGQFLSFLAAGYLLQTPVVSIGSNVLNFTRGLASAERALELLDDEPAIVDPAEPMSLPPAPLSVELRGVSFAYDGEEETVKDVSFKIQGGERAVLVGESGAGKSTLAKLLLRFYDPTEGEILLGGVPLKKLDRDSLYKATAYVSQEVFLFEASIRDNLLVGAASASDEEVWKVLRVVGLDVFVESLPQGLDTEVHERGLRLSGGQRQRLAIARALLCDAEILLLDEATSALDMESERLILENLFGFSSSRIVIWISHRLSIAHSADRVLSLKDGRVVEDGPAKLLEQQDGEFARLSRAAH